MLWALQSCSSYWDTWYLYFGFARKAFLSTIFLIIVIHPWNKLNLDTLNNLHYFCYGHSNHVLLIGVQDIDAFGFRWKAFLSLSFLIFKIYPWNKTNLDTNNNLYFFCYWQCNLVLHIGILDINAFDLQENLFFPPISL